MSSKWHLELKQHKRDCLGNHSIQGIVVVQMPLAAFYALNYPSCEVYGKDTSSYIYIWFGHSHLPKLFTHAIRIKRTWVEWKSRFFFLNSKSRLNQGKWYINY